VYKVKNQIYFNPGDVVPHLDTKVCTIVSYVRRGTVAHTGLGPSLKSGGLQAASGFTGRPIKYMDYLELLAKNYRFPTGCLPLNVVQLPENLREIYRINPTLLGNYGITSASKLV
jgi:hypothetical protein